MDISISSFINTIFPPHLVGPQERVCLSLGSSDGKFYSYVATQRRLAALSYQARTGPHSSWYFCVSTVKPPTEDGYLGRGKDRLVAAWCVVLDDVGTKAQEPPVAPSWVLESSEGNYQWGYLIEPLELTPAAMLHYENCVRGLAQAGYSDPGAQGAYRIMRVPGSKHRTGFISRVVAWDPSRMWELDALMLELGVEPAPGGRVYREREARPGGADVLAECEDIFYRWLVDHDKVLGCNQEWVFIECPWRHEHTGGDQGPSSTAYSPMDYGRTGRSFKCLHGHCSGRGLNDFVQFINKLERPL